MAKAKLLFILDLRLVEIRQVYVHFGVGLYTFVDQKPDFWIPRASANRGFGSNKASSVTLSQEGA